MAEPRTREWSLIAFTVGLQLAAGIEFSSALLLWRLPGDSASLTVFAISVFPITVLAAGASLFHLGQPHAAWRAFTNIGQSKLSREIAIYAAFCASTLVQFVSCLLYGISLPGPTLVSAAVGIAAVIASAKIYTVPAQPFWNSGWVTGSFIGSTLLFGGVITNIVAEVYISGVMALAGAIVFLWSNFGMLASIMRSSRTRYSSPESLPILRTKHWLILCGSIVGTVITILGTIAKPTSAPFAIATAIVAALGVVLGRAFMYSRGTALARF